MLLDQVVVELQVMFLGEHRVSLHVDGCRLVQAKICGGSLGFKEFVCEHLFVSIPLVQTMMVV